MEGPTEPVMDYYHALMSDKEALTIRQNVLESGQVQNNFRHRRSDTGNDPTDSFGRQKH